MMPAMEAPTSGIALVKDGINIKVMVKVKGVWRTLYTETIQEIVNAGDHIIQFTSERYEEASEDKNFNTVKGY